MSKIVRLPPTTAKKPPVREFEWIPGATAGGGMLVLSTGGKVASYAVAEINCGETRGRGFTLVKIFGGTSSEQRYDVFIDDANPQHDHCTCIGFLHKGRCKHAESLRTLMTVSRETDIGRKV